MEDFAEFLDLIGQLPGVPRVVLASSGGTIYGNGKPPFGEDSPLAPTGRYGASKKAAEEALSGPAAFPARPPDLQPLRPRATAGTGQGVVAQWLDDILSGRTPTLIGSPRTARDFVFVGDIADGLLTLGHSDFIGPLNLGGGRPTTLEELAATLSQVAGVHVDFKEAPARAFDVETTGSSSTGQLRCSVGRLVRPCAPGWPPRGPIFWRNAVRGIMRRAPALAGTFFNNWANYGFKEAAKQTREWVHEVRSGAPAHGQTAGPWKGLSAAPTTTWITLEDWLYAESAGHPEPLVMEGPPSRILFIAPPFGKGSGGHWDIMRLIAALQAGGAHVELRIYLADGRVDLTEQRELIRDHFPITAAACDLWSRSEVGATDAVVATGWNTAFAALNCRAGRKIYMVQDYEPWFYAVGTDSILADMTYDFGFDLLTAGDWLSVKLADRNIGRVATFSLGFDSQVYRSHASWKDRTGVLFYLRPATPRRAWEYGAEALRIFHAQHPEAPIHLVGGRTNLRLPFPATIHDVMTPEQLAELYNTCRVGLAISLSNTSLLPVEMLACGTEVVTNDSEANRANLGNVSGVTFAELQILDLFASLEKSYSTPVDPAVLAGLVASRAWTRVFADAVSFIIE